MLTATGHSYQLDLGVSGAMGSDPSWLTGPVTATYPVDVVSLAALSSTAARAVVRWRGPPGEIRVGDPVNTHVPGIEIPGVAPTVSVTAVAELDLALTAGPAPPSMALQLLAAVAILATVVYFSHKISGPERIAA
jgi:hypothetical protein